jgi:hypothetical protein
MPSSSAAQQTNRFVCLVDKIKNPVKNDAAFFLNSHYCSEIRLS